jgi:hypothetical protein
MKKTKPITAKEYQKEIKWAKRTMHKVDHEVAEEARFVLEQHWDYKKARVLLALYGAWREVRHRFVSDEVGNDLAARHGLPVDGGGDLKEGLDG